MKKSALTFVVTILTAATVSAQQKITVYEPSDSCSGKTVTVGSGADDFTVTGGGYEFCFGDRRKASDKRPSRKRNNGHMPMLEAGFNMLPSPGYKSYPTGTPDFMDLNNARSFQVALNLLDVAVPFNKAGTLGLSAALGIVWDDYVFSDDIRLVKSGGRLEPLPLDPSYKKSKLNTFAIRIPVMLDWSLPRGFYVSAGVYGSALMGSHTKIKFPKEKMRNPYTRPFEAGIIARVGYRWVGVYCRRAVTSLFKADRGPKVYPTTVGLCFDF